ncbi:MAG TPA: bifunctional diaminohydroxyphosphoribosylaminopyrimidine deaminase/5-amino-6-(5-phosphoribosylamino)uracil reductase RibD [Egibacteraceae bacterium]|nr:bifunctional diaminohydroxyphosphoribosylaminopyrimidine deaminase/5-amino-6-(5-phosphoribosylamino)uracil reductase RibD [Egibacteraceae bacterium]
MAGDDERWMRRALALAERGRGTTSPNPLAGCVLVRERTVVGEGFHAVAGGPHAEVEALDTAGELAAGATAYVTLEPCDHHGRTGPCSQALLDAGVSRVVAAIADPHPQAGGGADRLRARGVDVEVGVCADAAARQNEVFLHGLAHARPFVILKAAMSIDGRIAAPDGTSQWLTGEAARARAHALRAEVDAVLVGSGTVLADDPLLTVRLPGHDGPQPLRVVLDRRGRVPAVARVLDGTAPSLVLDTDPAGTCKALWDRDVRSVLVEGGAQVAAAFLDAGLVDKLVVHLAPLMLGSRARPLVESGPSTLTEASRWTLADVDHAGDDVILTYYPGEA